VTPINSTFAPREREIEERFVRSRWGIRWGFGPTGVSDRTERFDLASSLVAGCRACLSNISRDLGEQ